MSLILPSNSKINSLVKKSFTPYVSGCSLFYPTGTTSANLAIVGFRPNDAKMSPFSGPSYAALRDLLATHGVPGNLLWKTYLCKTEPCNVADNTYMDMCRDVLIKELEIVKPKAVVVLGGLAAFHILRYDESRHIDDYRKICWMHHDMKDMCVFVTHSVESLNPKEPAKSQEFEEDFLAVAFADANYYNSILEVETNA